VKALSEEKEEKVSDWNSFLVVRINKEVKKKAEEAARARGLSLSSLVRVYIIQLAKEQDRGEKHE
jgi:antitoxin component of RelBE/YafQ-DinJ toxin-antitoxin module